MPEILALLQSIAPVLSKTTLRQMSYVIYGMLVANGRITMLGLARWTEKGGSYRTLQRWYYGELAWKAIHWLLFRLKFMKVDDEYLIAGDEVVASKAGKATYRLDRFFPSIQQRVISGLSFFTFSLVNVQEERSYLLQVTQVVKSAEEKAASKAKAEAKKAAKTLVEKRKRGRPKGSKNKVKQEVVLSSELARIQSSLTSLLEMIGTILSLKYVVLDGHFGNYPSAFMVRETNLHLISKMRWDVALYEAFEGKYAGKGSRPKYGQKLDVRHLDDDKYLKATSTEKNILICGFIPFGMKNTPPLCGEKFLWGAIFDTPSACGGVIH
jgi:putative transposase